RRRNARLRAERARVCRRASGMESNVRAARSGAGEVGHRRPPPGEPPRGGAWRRSPGGMVGSRPLLVRRSALVRRSGGARYARGLCTTTPHRLQSERSERRRSRGPPRRPLACRGPARDPAHAARLGRHAPPRPAMTFRARLLLGFGAVVLVPLTVFGLRIRAVMANRLTAEYQQRVAALVSVIRADLDQRSAAIALRLAALRDAIPRDNPFRTALQGGERRYLLDYAGDAMQLTGLALLQIQDESGRIVSSGHFRNEYDRSDPALQVVSAVTVPFVMSGDSARLLAARIVVSHSLASLVALRRGVALSFLVAVLVTGLIALLLASWLSTRISRPLTALAAKTADVDMDRLDVAFDSDRSDEIGALSRLLGAMTERLRAGAARLREAERRLAMGDLARQVNHDIKNGLIPIRNVFRHLGQAAGASPDRLAAAFRDRQATVESSISYLENLA